MPFQSEQQRKYLWANEPEIAKRWEKYPKGYNTGGVSHLFRSKEPAQGGYIRPEDSGVLGLADGGQLVKPGSGRPGYGGPQDWGQEARQEGPYSTGDVKVSNEPDYGRPTMRDVAGPVQPTKTVTSTRDDGRHHPGVDTPTQIAEQKKLDIAQDIKRREEEKGGIEYYGQRKTLYDQQNLENKTNEYILRNLQKLDPDKYYEDMNAFKKAWEIGKSIPTPTVLGLLKAMYDEHKLTSEGKSILDEWKQYVGGPPGSNPEAYDALWLALEKRKPKYRYDDEGERDEDITTTTTIEEGVSKYPTRKEMMAAAQRAYEMLYGDRRSAQIPEDTSKRDAYLAAYRQKYLMGAKGGRVPTGYNTGGLSNLFRLKNK